MLHTYTHVADRQGLPFVSHLELIHSLCPPASSNVLVLACNSNYLYPPIRSFTFVLHHRSDTFFYTQEIYMPASHALRNQKLLKSRCSLHLSTELLRIFFLPPFGTPPPLSAFACSYSHLRSRHLDLFFILFSPPTPFQAALCIPWFLALFLPVNPARHGCQCCFRH